MEGESPAPENDTQGPATNGPLQGEPPSSGPPVTSPLPEAAVVAAPAPPPPQNASKSTSKPCDVCYALDFSGSIPSPEFVLEKAHAVLTADAIIDADPTARFGAVRFAGAALPPFITPLTTQNDFNLKVNAFPVDTAGFTSIADGIAKCGQILNINDQSRQKSLVIISDGGTQDEAAAMSEATTLKDQGVKIIGVVPRDVNVNTGFLAGLTGELGGSLVFRVTDVKEVGAAACPADPCILAEQNCRFGFFGAPGLNTFNIFGPPDVAFTPRIISKTTGEFIGILNSKKELPPEFIDSNGLATSVAIAIPGFTPTQFKPYAIAPMFKFSGVGHETYQVNTDGARDQCLRVFFSNWQILDGPFGNVDDNIDVDANKGDNCVVFRTPL